MSPLQGRKAQEMEAVKEGHVMICRECRDQLRTDEAIERVAQAIGEWEPEDWDNPEFREDRAFWTDKARTAINALLGEDQ